MTKPDTTPNQQWLRAWVRLNLGPVASALASLLVVKLLVYAFGWEQENHDWGFLALVFYYAAIQRRDMKLCQQGYDILKSGVDAVYEYSNKCFKYTEAVDIKANAIQDFIRSVKEAEKARRK